VSQTPNPETRRQSTRLRRIAEPWTLVVFVTAAFHFFRGAPIDGAFFLSVAFLLIADALGWIRFRVPAARIPALSTLLGVAVVLGILLVLAPRHGTVEGLIVSAIGVWVLVTAWNANGTRAADSVALRRSIILFTAVGIIGCLIEVSSYLLGLPSQQAMFEHPSVSLLLDPWVDTIEGRIVFTGLWLLAGVWFLRRGERRASS
jgi:hypothetical protein